MYPHLRCKALRYGAVLLALCAFVLAFPQFGEAAVRQIVLTSAQESQGSLMSQLLDRLVTVISLAEFQDREFDQSVADIRELLPRAPLRGRSTRTMWPARGPAVATNGAATTTTDASASARVTCTT